MLSIDDVFFASALIFLLLIPVVWFARPKLAGSAGGAGGSGSNVDAAVGVH